MLAASYSGKHTRSFTRGRPSIHVSSKSTLKRPMLASCSASHHRSMDSIYLPTRIPFWWKPRKKLNHCQSLNSGFRYGSARSNQQAQLTQHIDLRRLRERVMRSICFLAKNDVRGLQDSRRKVSIDLRPTALTQTRGTLRTIPTWTRESWRPDDPGHTTPRKRCSSAFSHIRMHSSMLSRPVRKIVAQCVKPHHGPRCQCGDLLKGSNTMQQARACPVEQYIAIAQTRSEIHANGLATFLLVLRSARWIRALGPRNAAKIEAVRGLHCSLPPYCAVLETKTS